MTADTTDRLWVRSGDCIERTIEGEAVLLNLKSGVYYSLNESGTAIWKLLESPCSVQDILTSLRDSYDLSPAEAVSQVEELLDDLASEKLIVEAGTSK